MTFWLVLLIKQSSIHRLPAWLRQNGLEFYRPVIRLDKSYLDIHHVDASLHLNSCIFVKLPVDNVLKLETISKFGNVLYWLNKPALVNDDEILLIREFLDTYTINFIEKIPVQIDVLTKLLKHHPEAQRKFVSLAIYKLGILLKSNSEIGEISEEYSRIVTLPILRKKAIS
ncbi:MAG: hypothetical protein EOP48_04915 [Sphingobacteriales bacterium]|nr:MAG: hypothetical protein EOP48_04915 [Sphingobacteriales bacterium]